MLKIELSASHVSAKASKGVVHIKALVTRKAIAEDLNCMFPCKDKSITNQMEIEWPEKETKLILAAEKPKHKEHLNLS